MSSISAVVANDNPDPRRNAEVVGVAINVEAESSDVVSGKNQLEGDSLSER